MQQHISYLFTCAESLYLCQHLVWRTRTVCFKCDGVGLHLFDRKCGHFHRVLAIVRVGVSYHDAIFSRFEVVED